MCKCVQVAAKVCISRTPAAPKMRGQQGSNAFTENASKRILHALKCFGMSGYREEKIKIFNWNSSLFNNNKKSWISQVLENQMFPGIKLPRSLMATSSMFSWRAAPSTPMTLLHLINAAVIFMDAAGGAGADWVRTSAFESASPTSTWVEPGGTHIYMGSMLWFSTSPLGRLGNLTRLGLSCLQTMLTFAPYIHFSQPPSDLCL